MMMRRLFVLVALLAPLNAQGQYGNYLPPDKLYGPLFTDIQMNRMYKDGKSFVDCIPNKSPAQIISTYQSIKNNPEIRFSLERFTEEYFRPPAKPADTFVSDRNSTVRAHIHQLWNVLQRNPDNIEQTGSLLPLPYPYIVPGGRFREIYYWDSYFTMLGLQADSNYTMIENMVKNFAYMIQELGHIPNGNRTYFLSRSQPPFFSMMLDLLAATKGNQIYAQYQFVLQKEYDYWMDKTQAKGHVVRMPDGSQLNRYYDQDVRPRQESFYEDSTLAIGYKGNREQLYRNLRSGAESGWDFSSRWLADGQHMTTIQTTNIVPVDLNALLCHLEQTLSKAYHETGNLLQADYYQHRAHLRQKAIEKYCWSPAQGWYFDYNIARKKQSTARTLAGVTPFFFELAPKDNAKAAAKIIQQKFLKPGGVVTTLKTTGQQWDAPNGWAPLQWMTVKGMENYGQATLAREIATRWVRLNVRVYHATGKLMEKYNVTAINQIAGGGEYPSQDGFGWTNGVLLKMMQIYNLQE